jgi:hypothetical protein
VSEKQSRKQIAASSANTAKGLVRSMLFTWFTWFTWFAEKVSSLTLIT